MRAQTYFQIAALLAAVSIFFAGLSVGVLIGGA